ncbi:MAG: alpha/beta fold hydrolase [Ilumatobacteraceae bacterium]
MTDSFVAVDTSVDTSVDTAGIIGRGRLHVRVLAGSHAGPPVVFLHEGLGSLDLWRSFPEDVRTALGGVTTVVYSRHGYGRSAVVTAPRAVPYMHDEALVVLPALLAELGIERPLLVGHSDGASIAIIHAGSGHPVAGLVLIAPHVFVEDVGIASIEAARVAYDDGDLRARLLRHHDDVDATFRGWNDIWLAPAFRAWNIEEYLPAIEAPVLVVQGDADEYGTLAQVDSIERGVTGPFERLVVAGAGHAPHQHAGAEVVEAIRRFMASA